MAAPIMAASPPPSSFFPPPPLSREGAARMRTSLPLPAHALPAPGRGRVT